MPGGWDNISDKLIRELRTAFALISKSLQTDGIDVALTVNSVIYPTDYHPQTASLPLILTQPATVDGLVQNRPCPCESAPLPLISPQATLSDIACNWQAVLVSEPVMSEASTQLRIVDFDNIRKPRQAKLPIPEIDPVSTIYTVPVPKMKTGAFLAELPKIASVKQVHKVPVTVFKRKTQYFPIHLWQLPLIKMPIPPHRFSTEMKAKFRKALAEKAFGPNSDMPQSNIQIQAVYDRINLGLFSNIDQDERGNLICYPKPELLKNPTLAGSAQCTYLVFGMRVDTRATLRVLVPMA